MADNYLEKQYENYLARKAEWLKKKKRTVKSRPTTTTRPATQPASAHTSSATDNQKEEE